MGKTRKDYEGNIRQRADGRWEVRVTLGNDFTSGGTRRISKYAATQEEAVRLLHELSFLRDTVPKSFQKAALPLPASTNYSKYMTAAINYIRDHFSEQLTLEQVAQELNISRSYLALIFKKETSLTFSIWLRKYRIGKAKELLKNTNMSQDDICTEVGIYDSSYLCRLFKEYEHLSPDEYRKNWRTVCAPGQ